MCKNPAVEGMKQLFCCLDMGLLNAGRSESDAESAHVGEGRSLSSNSGFQDLSGFVHDKSGRTARQIRQKHNSVIRLIWSDCVEFA